MEGMKGLGRTIATILGQGMRIELLTYLDGSMGIRQNATTIGVWERAEQEECVRTFMGMGTARNPVSALVLIRRRTDGTIDAAASARVVVLDSPHNNN